MTKKLGLLIDEKLLALLACPACQGKVEIQKDEKESSLICARCGHVYPVVDGIPVLLA